jgi:hypothetical protein
MPDARCRRRCVHAACCATGGRPLASARPLSAGDNPKNSAKFLSEGELSSESARTIRAVHKRPGSASSGATVGPAATGRQFARDSPLEEAGFELSVPRDTTKVSRPPHVLSGGRSRRSLAAATRWRRDRKLLEIASGVESIAQAVSEQVKRQYRAGDRQPRPNRQLSGLDEPLRHLCWWLAKRRRPD